MKVFGFAGHSGSGKTTLLRRLIPVLTARGLRVSTIKHAHHGFDVDAPGKDSHTHREAGATEVMVSSASRWALMHENRETPEATLDDLLARMSPVDLVLIEGFKREEHDKMEIVRGADEAAVLSRSDKRIVAIASDKPLAGEHLPVFDIDDAEAVADFVMQHCGFALSPAHRAAGGRA
jgi:molybdopterin-guanine dinucleotide biosynthesis protein B